MIKRKTQKIFILHGWTSGIDKWKVFQNELSNVGLSSELILIPGLTSKLKESWKLDDYVIWLKNKLKDQKNIILIGHSFGGQIAIRYAKKYPKYLDKLFLVDSSGIRDRRFFIRLKRKIYYLLAKIGKSFSDNNKLRKILYFLAREKDYLNASPMMKKTMINVLNDEIVDDLSILTIPTCIIWGKLDSITPLYIGKYMNERIKRSKLHIIWRARHAPQFTHAKEVTKIIKQFVNAAN